MFNTDRIVQEFSFEADLIEAVNGAKKIAFVFTAIKAVAKFLLLTLFCSLFLSILRIFLLLDTWITYGILVFIVLFLGLILYFNFKKNITTHLKMVFPSVSLSSFTQNVIILSLIGIIFLIAWQVSVFTMDNHDFMGLKIGYILRIIIHLLVVFALAVLMYLFTIPIKRFEKVYHEKIVLWLFKKIDISYCLNKNHNWSESFLLWKPIHSEEKKEEKGITIFDVNRAFPGYQSQLDSAYFNDSVSFKLQSTPVHVAQVNVNMVKRRRTPGKTKIEILPIFTGSMLAAPIHEKHILTRVNTKIGEPMLLGESIFEHKETVDNLSVEVAGYENYLGESKIIDCVKNIESLWNTDVAIILNDGFAYLLLHEVNLFTSLALSASLYSDTHLRTPLKTLELFYNLVQQLNEIK